MKHSKFFFLLTAFLVVAALACKKDKSTTDDEIETTFQLSEDQAAGESLADDANVLFFEVAANAGLMTGRTAQNYETTNSLSCATVTITPQNTFPKTIVIDFGSGCTSMDGIARSGKINISLSDSVHHPGAVAIMSFDNYFVEDYKVEGTITWTNTSSPNGISWTRTIADGKITAPGGNYYWLHTGSKTVQQTAGANTPLNFLDDVYSITGDHTVTNPAGKSRTATITEVLEKKLICHNVSKGKIKIQGPNHFAILDYGDGTCDRVATISIDGNTPRTILLP
ncbi:MAG: hypothetical protein GC171_15405 [Terrimonas sp.]|nr:hypothetical protein [Terrimonas sp.]